MSETEKSAEEKTVAEPEVKTKETEMDTTSTTPTKLTYNCKTCKQFCTSKESYDKHILTDGHKKKEEQIEKDKERRATARTSRNDRRIAARHARLEAAKKREMNTKGGRGSAFKCPICITNCNNIPELKMHFMSTNHFMNMMDNAGYREVAFEDSHIGDKSEKDKMPLLGVGYIREHLIYDVYKKPSAKKEDKDNKKEEEEGKEKSDDVVEEKEGEEEEGGEEKGDEEKEGEEKEEETVVKEENGEETEEKMEVKEEDKEEEEKKDEEKEEKEDDAGEEAENKEEEHEEVEEKKAEEDVSGPKGDIIVLAYRCLLCRCSVPKNGVVAHIGTPKHYKTYLKKHEKERFEALKLDAKDQSVKGVEERKTKLTKLAKELIEETGVQRLKRCEATIARNAIGIRNPIGVRYSLFERDILAEIEKKNMQRQQAMEMDMQRRGMLPGRGMMRGGRMGPPGRGRMGPGGQRRMGPGGSGRMGMEPLMGSVGMRDRLGQSPQLQQQLILRREEEMMRQKIQVERERMMQEERQLQEERRMLEEMRIREERVVRERKLLQEERFRHEERMREMEMMKVREQKMREDFNQMGGMQRGSGMGFDQGRGSGMGDRSFNNGMGSGGKMGRKGGQGGPGGQRGQGGQRGRGGQRQGGQGGQQQGGQGGQGGQRQGGQGGQRQGQGGQGGQRQGQGGQGGQRQGQGGQGQRGNRGGGKGQQQRGQKRQFEQREDPYNDVRSKLKKMIDSLSGTESSMVLDIASSVSDEPGRQNQGGKRRGGGKGRGGKGGKNMGQGQGQGQAAQGSTYPNSSWQNTATSSSDFGQGTGATYMSFDDQASSAPFTARRDLTISEQMGLSTGYGNFGGSTRMGGMDSYSTSGYAKSDWSTNQYF